MSTSIGNILSLQPWKTNFQLGGKLLYSSNSLRNEGVKLSSKQLSGFRSSYSGTVATVFGATGCMGRYVTNRLGKNGSQIIIPYHKDHYSFLELKLVGDLGQVVFTPYYLKDEDSLRKAMKYSNIVINLTGKEWPTRNFSFHDINVTGPRTLARIAKECGVERFIHISSVNAREKPQRVFLPQGSQWLKTKWEGEQAVFKEFPDATIFRASDIYGYQSSFINQHLLTLKSLGYESLYLWKKGEETLKRPVFANDLCSGIMAALNKSDSKGQIYEALGPETFRHFDLVKWMYYLMNKEDESRFPIKDLRMSPVSFLYSYLSGFIPVATRKIKQRHLDALERMNLSDRSSNYLGLEHLGVELESVTTAMPPLLAPHRINLDILEYTFANPKVRGIPTVGRVEAKQILEYNY